MPRPSRGRQWIGASFGQMSFGDPAAEWGHITPRFPAGITNSVLSRATFEVQRETVLAWFGLNLVPYDLTKGGPYFGFAQQVSSEPSAAKIAGFDQGYFAPTPINSIEPLLEEFSDSLTEEVIRSISDNLPGKWMWISYSPRQAVGPDALATLLAGLDDLKQKIKELGPTHGGIGHNHPHDEAFDAVERDRAVLNLEEIETIVPVATKADEQTIGHLWATVLDFVQKHSKNIMGTLVLGIIGGVGRAIGGDLWRDVHPALQAWETMYHVGGLLAQFINLL